MQSKQKENSTEGFWSGLDESDEDFETLIGIGQRKEEEQQEASTMMENPDFLLNKKTDGNGDKSEESKVSGPIGTLEGKTGLFYENTEDVSTVIKEETRDVCILKQAEDSNLDNFTIDENASVHTATTQTLSKPSPAETYEVSVENKVLSAEKMDFLWDDDDEDVDFIAPVKKEEVPKQVENGKTDQSIVIQQSVDKSNPTSVNDACHVPLLAQEISEQPLTQDVIEQKVQELEIVKPERQFIPRKPMDKTCEVKKESKPSKARFEFSIQHSNTCFLGKFLLGHAFVMQKRRNQLGEYFDKETSVLSIYKYKIVRNLNINASLDNIIQEGNEFDEIVQLLSLKDPHVDNVCSLLKAKDVVYSTQSYTEHYDYVDVNSIIDLALSDKEMAIDLSCKKNLWSLALLISNNRKDIIQKFMEKTIDNTMIPLALSVFTDVDNTPFMVGDNWKKHLKHLLRIPLGNLHLKVIDHLYDTDKHNLYVFLTALHLLKIGNIGNFKEYYSMNMYFLQFICYFNKHLTPVTGIDIMLYNYIKIIYEFDKETAELFYKNNKKIFNYEQQASLDRVFNVSGWGFGFKNVLNFGISKILNVEEEQEVKQPVKLPSFTPPVNEGLIKPKVNREFKKPAPSNDTYGAINLSNNDNNAPPPYSEVTKESYNEVNKPSLQTQSVNVPLQRTNELKDTSKREESRPLYSEQQHSKSFADIMELDKSHSQNTIDNDAQSFLSQYSIDDEEVGISKAKEVKNEEGESKSFFSMFNIFKKPVYKVDLQASDDIKYDPVTKKWVSGSAQSAPPEVKNIPTKSVPLPPKGNIASKSSVDLSSMSLYANKKPTSKAVIPGISLPKKPTDKKDQM